MIRALTDGLGNAYYLSGQMVVVQTDEPEPAPSPTPRTIVANGDYVPFNALKRTLVRQHSQD